MKLVVAAIVLILCVYGAELKKSPFKPMMKGMDEGLWRESGYKNFTQRVDHFDIHNEATFEQRVLFN